MIHGWPTWVGRVQRWSLYGLLLLLPFSKAAVEIGSTLLIIGWVAARLDPRTRADSLWWSRRPPTLAVAVLAFLAICAFSIVVSDHRHLSLTGFVGKWLQYVLLCVAAADVATQPGVAARSLTVLAWSSAVVGVEALTQEAFGEKLFRRSHDVSIYGRMTGPYENPIDLGTYLMVVLPILLAWSVVARGRIRPALWALMGALALCLARTQSLGAWLGCGIGVLLLALGDRRIQRYGVVVVAIVAVTGAFFLQRVGPGFIQQHLFSLSDVGKSDRLAMWQAAVGMIRDRPWFGHGLNTFMANYLDYWVGGERMPRYAHNCYLQMAAETGLVGLGLFGWLLWSIGARLVAGLRRLAGDERIILMGLCAGLFAFLAQSAIDTNFYSLRQAALFWTLAGIAIGCATRTA